MKQASILLVCAAVLLSACGQGKTTTSPAATTSQAQATTVAPSPTATATPVPSTTPVPEKQAQQIVKKDYHMNKNYDIVPNDPNGNKKVVLLTFDDGPKEQEMNASLIATLKKHNAKAIFFMNGYRIKQKPELVKLVHESGQVIGNHAWDHDNLKDMKTEKIDQQVDDVQKIVKELIGQEPQFFRPPFGAGNDYLKDKIKNNHILYMTWSNGSLDWEMTNKKNDPNKVLENVMKQLHGGSNILMHELPWTVSILDTLLTQLEEKGYSFVDPNAIELEMR
ncbi:polysaccharide deacetylase family protein [Paenibacillus sp. SYP-B3998]|uniref:Polysaccharide deacetylase family protein n=1 Tax=Paenibacillus sp. SYP-B3998 TaxID=2678564 RepID=A0A6G3ZV77_9BACL|nr:polysaccharide deacetylase family protein [Paenibacillus sp. SYP-B3998]NEW06113.1 polysaccharide deacetylase family protein [Paenibacillus sp. SYP-B3998]